jgi:ribosome-binding factor A
MSRRQSDKRASPSQRQLRVGELIRHALADMLTRGQIREEALTNYVVTVSEVRMSPDLRQATIYVISHEPDGLEPVLAAFERSKRYIRGQVAQAVNLKFAPDIRFIADETFDEAQRIDALLRSPRVAQDLKKS